MASSLHRGGSWLAHVFKATTQQHHRELIEVFRPYIPADAVVFDIGAHAGQFAKLFARLAAKGQVFAFEPSAYARSVLEPALAWNHMANVEIVPMGLSDADGALVLHTPIKRRGGVGFGLAHLGAAADARPSMEQTVQLTTLDGFFAGRGLTRLDFIKADVEGWEAHVLAGGARTLAAHRPVLFLEVNESFLGRAGSNVQAIWGPLAALGYRVLKATDFTPVEGFAGDGDYLFLP